MFKRLLSTLLCLCCLLLQGPAPAEAPPETPDASLSAVAARLATLDIASQMEDRFLSTSFIYMNTMFYEQGCLPSSVYNALVAAIGTPETDAAALLPELITTITNPRAPRDSMVMIELLPDALNAAKGPATAALAEGIDVRSWSTLRNVETTLQEVRARDGSLLLVDKLNVYESWEQLVDLALQLDSMGLGQARLAFASVGAGYGNRPEAPFGSGENGHYIALYLQVDEFCRTGTFYLLDSVPRALADEERGEGTLFRSHYSFVLYKTTSFRYNFTAARITNTVVQFNLTEDQRTQLDALLTDPTITDEYRHDQLLKLHKRHMDSVIVYGVNQGMLYIPD